MPSEARQKKIMEKLNRAQKCSILGPQNLGSGGAPPGSAPACLPRPRENRQRKDCSQGNHINFLFVGQFSSTCNLNLFGTATARLSII